METNFNYKEVPNGFGHCAVTTCSKRETCLRYLAWQHAPAGSPYLPLLNTRYLEALGNKCDQYKSCEKVAYAKGFARMLDTLTIKAASSLRYRLRDLMGFRTYYLCRKGERLLSPAEQKRFIEAAKALGIQKEDYFDAYVEQYQW